MSGRRLRVLLSAYACEPGKGSEPGVGWNLARALARDHDVWVLTRANNRSVIEEELARHPVPGMKFIYHDLPSWIRWWKRGGRGIQLYYYMWQVSAKNVVRQVHEDVRFDVAQHLTFVKYWAPSILTGLPVRGIWGPVAGAETTPKAFLGDLPRRGRVYEAARRLARWVGERDPQVRAAAQRCDVALAATADTAARLGVLGAHSVNILPAVGLTGDEIRTLGSTSESACSRLRFISIGRLLHWKGFHLGLRAFAQLDVEDAEYSIVGDGPELARLRQLALELGVEHRVTFPGRLSRPETLARLAASSVLLHPSLHDSGGFVCLEAMAARKPVICLDLGGPGVITTDETGFKLPAVNPDQAVRDIATAMKAFVDNPSMLEAMGEAGRRRVQEHFTWDKKREILGDLYEQVLARTA